MSEGRGESEDYFIFTIFIFLFLLLSNFHTFSSFSYLSIFIFNFIFNSRIYFIFPSSLSYGRFFFIDRTHAAKEGDIWKRGAKGRYFCFVIFPIFIFTSSSFLFHYFHFSFYFSFHFLISFAGHNPKIIWCENKSDERR